jgi:hypothetical protein
LSKVSSSIIGYGDSGDDSSNVEDMSLFVKRFNCYIKKHGLRKVDKDSSNLKRSQAKGESNQDDNTLSCYGCGKVGNLRNECPDPNNSKGRASSSDKSKRGRAYITLEDEDPSSTKSDSKNDEISHLCFMGQKKNSIEVSNSNSNSKPSYDELQNILIEMHEATMKALLEQNVFNNEP